MRWGCGKGGTRLKTLVYELAEFRNKRDGKPVIPESTLLKAPSAELRPDQKDEDSLPPYPVLDPILKAYVEEDKGNRLPLRWGRVRVGVDKRFGPGWDPPPLHPLPRLRAETPHFGVQARREGEFLILRFKKC